MSNFNLVNSQTLPLTKELAVEFNQMKASPTERDLDPRRVKHLREKAEAGLLTPFGWAKAKIGGEWVRMNGQHSSTMLAEMNGSFPDGLLVHMDEYEVDSPEGLASLFRQFDDRKSSRSPADVSGAYQGLYPELNGVNKANAKIAIEGVVWYRRSIEGAPMPTGDEQYQFFSEKGLHGFVHFVGSLFSMKTPEMRRVQVVSAIYATYVANEVAAKEFWNHVARGGMEYEDNHPTTILSTWLQDARNPDSKLKPKPAEFYNASIYAWNASREGKELKSINISKLKSNLEAEG